MENELSMERPLAHPWRVPGALLLLTAVPFAAGIVRLVELSKGAVVTAKNARFFESPTPVVIHILAVTVYCLLGAFQFSAALRQRSPRWHRLAGRVLVPAGYASALTGLWMAVYYPLPTSLQGPVLLGFRLFIGTAMLACLSLGVLDLLRRRFARHGEWMIRAYAIGQGAGTQAVIMGPIIVLLGEPLGLTRDLLMILCWLINLAVAEWAIRRLGA